MHPDVSHARAVLAARKRHQHRAADVTAAEVDLKAAKLTQAIQRAVASAPPLTDAQRMRLAAIFLTVDLDGAA
jgi:hypothetical protein